MLLSSRYLRTRQVYTLHRCSLSDPHCNTLLLFLLVLCETFPGRVFSSPSWWNLNHRDSLLKIQNQSLTNLILFNQSLMKLPLMNLWIKTPHRRQKERKRLCRKTSIKFDEFWRSKFSAKIRYSRWMTSQAPPKFRSRLLPVPRMKTLSLEPQFSGTALCTHDLYLGQGLNMFIIQVMNWKICLGIANFSLLFNHWP